MAPINVDYSLYLVTDSTSAILGDKDLVSVVKDAVEGGMCAKDDKIPSYVSIHVLKPYRCHHSSVP